MLLIRYFSIVFFILIISCHKTPYDATNKVYKKQMKIYAKRLSEYPLVDTVGFKSPVDWVGTTNFNMRKPNFVIIHHTAQNSCDQTLKTFTLPRTQVSAHYVICEDGTVHHMLNDYLRAWHAGTGKWGNNTDINSSSIGIELDNDGFEPFAEPQMRSLLQLLENLKKAYSITTANFIGHADIAPTRKNDPNVNFDWKLLAQKGFGNWYDDTTGITIPTYFEPLQALRIIGYDTRDSSAAIATFKRKYMKIDKSRAFTEGDKKVLYKVMQNSY